MIRRPPRSTRTDTRFPYTTLFRSVVVDQLEIRLDGGASVPARVGPGQEVLFDGQVLEAVAPLHHLHHAGLYQVVGGQRIDAGALQLDRALGDRSEERRVGK